MYRQFELGVHGKVDTPISPLPSRSLSLSRIRFTPQGETLTASTVIDLDLDDLVVLTLVSEQARVLDPFGSKEINRESSKKEIK